MVCIITLWTFGSGYAQTLEDWSTKLGIQELGEPSYSTGWLDIDLDGKEEAFLVGIGKIWYVETTGAGYILKEVPLPGYALDVPPVASVSLDADRDGHRDLMLIGDKFQVFRLVAPGTFESMPMHSEKFLPVNYVSDAASGDFNADGWPDVVVCTIGTDGQHAYPRGATDLVFMNRGGQFEVMELEPVMRTMSHGVTVVDMNADGRPDIVESLDFSSALGASRILINDTPAGARKPVFVASEKTYDEGTFGMGAAVEDINQDGYLDIYNTSLGRDFLMYGRADGGFDDKTFELGVVHDWASNVGRVQWSPVLVDFNGDGRIDIFIRHGHVTPLDFFASATTAPQPDLLYLQQEDGRFVRDAVPFDTSALERGHDGTVGDLDDDGYPDVIMGSAVREFFLDPALAGGDGHPLFFHNTTKKQDGAQAFGLTLKPTVSADPPSGARVKATCGDDTLWRHVTAGGNPGGSGMNTLFLAWSACDEDVQVEVSWPSGLVSTHSVPNGSTSALVEETEWNALSQDDEGWTLTLTSTPDQEACFSNDAGEVWTCCNAEMSPCIYAYVAHAVNHGLVKLGDSPARALPLPYGEYLLSTDPALPVPGEPFEVTVQQGGVPGTFDVEAPWIKVNGEKVEWNSVDPVNRTFSAVLMAPDSGDVGVKLLVTTKNYRTWFIPTGIVVDPRYVDYFVFPHQVMYPVNRWWVMLSPRPASQMGGPTGYLSLRLNNGTIVPSTWKLNGVGRLVGEVEWGMLPFGAQLTLYDGESAVLGPLDTFHAPGDEGNLDLVDSVRGFISRVSLVENGGLSRLAFTLIDAFGYPVGAFPDWVVVEGEGVSIVSPVELAHGVSTAGGDVTVPAWDLAVLFRADAGTGVGKVHVKMKDGRLLGTWTVTKRSSLGLKHDPVLSSSEVLNDSLPAGVNAKTNINVYPRNELNELLGMDVEVRLEGPGFVRLDQPKITESGHFEGKVYADYFGGMADIDVFVNGEIFATHTVEIIGPALPKDQPQVTYTETDSDISDPPAPDEGGGSDGCASSAGTQRDGIPFLPLWLLTGFFLWSRWSRRGVVALLTACTMFMACDSQDPQSVDSSTDASSLSDAVPIDKASDDTFVTEDTQPDAPEVTQPPWAELSVAPHHCTPPEVLPEDPVEVLQTIEHGLQVSHLMDVEVDPDSGLLIGYGFPGMYVYEQDEEGVWHHLSMYPTPNIWMGYDYVPSIAEFSFGEVLGDNMVVLSARGQTPPYGYIGSASQETHGLYFIDTTNPAEPTLVADFDLYDLSGVVRQGDLLYALSYAGNLHVLDVTDVRKPKYLGFTALFYNSWRMIVVGDYGYVADNLKGLTVVDLSDPIDPVLVKTVKGQGGVQDIWHANGYIYAAVGSPGVEVFDLSDPTLPVSVGTIDIGPSVVGVSVSNDLLWATNNEAAAVFSLKDPAKPELIGYEETSDWALNAFADGDIAYISDWDWVHVMKVYPDRKAPELDPHPENIYFSYGNERVREMTIANMGTADLVLEGMKTESDHYEVRAEKLSLKPGEKTTVYILLKDGMEAVQTKLCVASNDPDESVRHFLVGPTSTNEGGAKVGDVAGDFLLPELHTGELYQLSGFLGQPIYLCFFSSW
jgi:hypothetical protein